MIKVSVKNNKVKKDKKYIDLFKYNKSQFREFLSEKCEPVSHNTDFNVLQSTLEESLMHCVKRQTRKSKVNDANKWFTREIRALKNKKIQCLRKASIFNSPEVWNIYRNVRNIYKNKLYLSKRNYICNKIESCHNQDMWKR